jgi:hypothetical protein
VARIVKEWFGVSGIGLIWLHSTNGGVLGKAAAITGFTAGEMEGNWQVTEVGLQVNLGRETATRAAKRLIMLPPFAPAAETWSRTTVDEHLH